MAIYTRFGTRVNFVAAQVFPVWIEESPGRIGWHLKPPVKTKGRNVHPMPVWFATVQWAESDPPALAKKIGGGGAVIGGYLHDGKGICTNDFVADGGLGEINKRCEELNAADAAKINQWLHGETASDLEELFGRGLAERLIY
jgi:hypothetical protein